MAASPRMRARYWALRREGFSMLAASREVGVSYSTVKRWESGKGRREGYEARAAREVVGPVPLGELSVPASRALGDFGFFQRRYFGRIATPWQEEAAERVVGLLESPEKEFAVINAPPGSGKSTTFTLDIPAWVTVRNRAIRGQIGSKVESSARRYTQRLRRAFERTTPIRAEAEQLARGLAVDAEATLIDDFGLFRPPGHDDMWSAGAFVVLQHGEVLIDEKEPTWSAYGMDSGFLGMRYDLVIWDDLVDKLVIRTAESRQAQKEWWDDVAEKRLEPGGLLVLQGQRMGADDLYRYALDKRDMPEDLDPELSAEDAAELGSAKYHHIVFRAHYEDRCRGEHRMDAPYYPEGCLLDPRRLSWRELRQEMANPRRNFEVIYQQEDMAPSSVLVDPLWVTGGTDPVTHVEHPGCVDRDRDVCELPDGLFGDLVSIATADPSPTRFWSIQWWVVRCVDGQAQERYLMDLERRSMDAPSFLDWNNATQSFSGLMQEWQQRSVDLRLPITTWIVEANAAQRFMLQYEFVRRWLATWRVDLIPHQTARNKSDPDYGVQTLGPLWKYGLIRLPGKPRAAGWLASAKLIEEVTHWSADGNGYSTDDCVMAHWFCEWHLPHLIPQAGSLPRFQRPSWLRTADTWGWRQRVG